MNHDLESFWPFTWLPFDPALRNTRIFSFGYNAFYLSAGGSNLLGISDFAKNLLYDMRYGRDDNGAELQLGRVRFGVSCIFT